MYDPKLRRFLTPDPVIAEPLSSQNYNPFSYVQNRPLAFTDPSGFQQQSAGPPIGLEAFGTSASFGNATRAGAAVQEPEAATPQAIFVVFIHGDLIEAARPEPRTSQAARPPLPPDAPDLTYETYSSMDLIGFDPGAPSYYPPTSTLEELHYVGMFQVTYSDGSQALRNMYGPLDDPRRGQQQPQPGQQPRPRHRHRRCRHSPHRPQRRHRPSPEPRHQCGPKSRGKIRDPARFWNGSEQPRVLVRRFHKLEALQKATLVPAAVRRWK